MDSSSRHSSPMFQLSHPALVTASDHEGGGDSSHHGFTFDNILSFSRIPETKLNCIGFAVLIYLLVVVFIFAGVYGPQNVWLGPNSSILVETSSIFVKSIEVKELDYSKSGLQLYGFYKTPPLNVSVNWSESHSLAISQDSYKGWLYYLNKGSHLNISYRVKPQGSAVQLVINEGMQGSPESLLNKNTFRETAWSWNLIQGNGVIDLDISESSRYHLAVASLKRKDVEVELDIDVRAVLYDTNQSFYNCTFKNGECSFKSPLVGNSFVITSPGTSQGVSIEDEWYLKLTYQPRCTAYVICAGMMLCFLVLVIQCSSRLQFFEDVEYRYDNDSARSYLLGDRDEDKSCYETFADNDNADLEDFVGTDGEAIDDGVCRICFDAPRDCFFQPCGHCASCYRCGTKTARTLGNCPICRAKLKKNAAEKPPFFIPSWIYVFNVFVVIWVLIVGFGFGGWATITNFVRQVDTFGLFAKC